MESKKEMLRHCPSLIIATYMMINKTDCIIRTFYSKITA